MAKKRSKGKEPSTPGSAATGAARGRAAAASQPDEPPAAPDTGRVKADKKHKKAKKADKREKRRTAKRGKQAKDARVAMLRDLATTSRKRLGKLADKLGSVTRKREAILHELAALSDGIAAVLRGLDQGTDSIAKRPAKSSPGA